MSASLVHDVDSLRTGPMWISTAPQGPVCDGPVRLVSHRTPPHFLERTVSPLPLPYCSLSLGEGLIQMSWLRLSIHSAVTSLSILTTGRLCITCYPLPKDVALTKAESSTNLWV